MNTNNNGIIGKTVHFNYIVSSFDERFVFYQGVILDKIISNNNTKYLVECFIIESYHPDFKKNDILVVKEIFPNEILNIVK